jgi:hypothetical protein
MVNVNLNDSFFQNVNWTKGFNFVREKQLKGTDILGLLST